MFRSKPPRHVPAASLSPASHSTAPTSPVSPNSPNPSNPTAPAPRSHRLRAPWRRAKTAVDLAPHTEPPHPPPATHATTRPRDHSPPSRASLSTAAPPDRKRGRNNDRANDRNDRVPPFYHDPDLSPGPPSDLADFPAAADALLPDAPALQLAAQPPSLTNLLALSPTTPSSAAPSRSQLSTPPPPLSPSPRPSGDRRTSGGGGDAMGADSASDDSFALAGKPPPTPRGGALKRFSAMFKDTDARHDENLKSMKRRVVQVRRQPDHAPIRFQMGFRSRTGWEPIRATKENQDCLVALVPWGPSSRFNFFAALDGHGRNGHQCAIFVAQRVVAYLRRMLQPLATRQAVANTLHRAIVYAERKLENVPDLDFSLSGSTGVFVLVHGCTLHCANVGDSRAVVGREEGKLRLRKQAIAQGGGKRGGSRSGGGSGGGSGAPLMGRYHPVAVSFDQKPARADEKARLLKAGARVDAWESVDVGDERVWLPTARLPGLAVSRSFGDTMLKPYGVDATPELYALELCADDRFIVMASDGVFEFISSEEAVEMVGRWRDRGSAQDAAEELVKVATDRWIDDDSVIDDISCVIVFMNVVAAEVSSPEQPYLVQTSIGNADGACCGSGNGSERGSLDDAVPRRSAGDDDDGGKEDEDEEDEGADGESTVAKSSIGGDEGAGAGVKTAESKSSRQASASASTDDEDADSRLAEEMMLVSLGGERERKSNV